MVLHREIDSEAANTSNKMQECLLVVLLLLCSVSGYPSGPPAADYSSVVCQELSPSLQAHGPPHSGHGGYLLRLQPPLTKVGQALHYEPGMEYNVELVGTTHSFKGFMIQARDPATPPPSVPHLIGQFTAVNDGAKTLNCDQGGVSAGATVAHSNALPRSVVQLTWTAPLSNGTVDFFYTVVREKAVHFDQLSAAQLGPPHFISDAPSNTLPPIKKPDKYRLQFQSPQNCTIIGDCSVYVAIDTNRGNDSWLDIYMEGEAEGWVGVGFTKKPYMFAADVVACNFFGDKTVVLDLFNPHYPSRTSLTDKIQDVYLFDGKYMDGRLSCTVIKRILPSDDFDIDLDQDLYVLYGKRSINATTLRTIDSHDSDPLISKKKINVAHDNGSASGENKLFKDALVKTHGALMLVTWPLLVVSGIFFPVFMKPALPGGGWFQIHRVLMLTSVVVGAVGFAVVFIAHIHEPIPGLIPLGQGEVLRTSHFSVGVLGMALHLINPIIGILRCSSDNPRRWIFDLLHGKVVGLFSLLLALVNIAIGAYLLDPTRVFWVVVAWEAVFLVTVLILLTMFSCLAARSPLKESTSRAPSPSNVQVLFKTESAFGGCIKLLRGCLKRERQEKTPLITNTVTGYKKLRWASFYVLNIVSVALVVAAIVLIALTKPTT